MKILALNHLNKSQGRHIENFKHQKNVTGQNNSIQNNTLQEAIGRSQVNFKGGIKTETGFEYTSNKINPGTDDIVYDKVTGQLTYIEYNSRGEIKRQLSFYPQQSKEVSYDVNPNSKVSTTRTKTPDAVVVVKRNSDGDVIYISETDINAETKKVTEIDYDRGRKVITFVDSNKHKDVQVINLDTMKPVVGGPLVEDRIYDKKFNRFVTKNIVTGQVYKVEEYEQKDKYSHIKEFSRSTGKLSYELIEDKTKKLTKFFREDGTLRVSKIFDKSTNLESISKFDEYGNPTKIQFVAYNRNGSTQSITNVNPENNSNIDKTEFDGNYKAYYTYNPQTSNISTLDEFYKGSIVCHSEYYSDGLTPKAVKEYFDDNHFEETLYSPQGVIRQRNYYKENEILYCFEKYDKNGVLRKKYCELNFNNGNYTVYSYDKNQVRKSKCRYDASDNLIYSIGYYEDGKTPRITREYNKSGMCFEKIYDSNGETISSRTFKNNNSNKNLDKIISEIESATSRSEFSFESISLDSWKAFSESIGLDDVNLLLHMDKKTYRTLAKKFHPDLQFVSDEEKEKAAVIFKILSNINEKLNK